MKLPKDQWKRRVHQLAVLIVQDIKGKAVLVPAASLLLNLILHLAEAAVLLFQLQDQIQDQVEAAELQADLQAVEAATVEVEQEDKFNLT